MSTSDITVNPAAPGNAVALIEQAPTAPEPVRSYSGPENSLSAFQSQSSFDSAQRMAKALASSTMVPKDYQGSVANCLVAMELASRTGASVLAVMQNTHIINGRPSWASTFLIGSVNSCGRFTALRYETRGGDDPKAKSYAVRAYATEKATGEKLVGEWIDWAMVDGEGWSKKQGSKWLTMAGQMFRYRAASFWTRSYAPEISLGMHSADEIEDTVLPTPAQAAVAAAATGSAKLRALVDNPALSAGGVTIHEPAAAPAFVDVILTGEDAREAMVDEVAPAMKISDLADTTEAAIEEPAALKAPTKAEEKETHESYVQRMKMLQMRRDSKKALTMAERQDLIKYEAIYES